MVATSSRVAWDRSEQHKTLPSYSDSSSSSATLLATVVFPKPGPPVKDTKETVPFRTASMACLISFERPNTSGRQFFNSSFHFSTSSSIRCCVPWSMAPVFRRFISCRLIPKTSKESEIIFHMSSKSSLETLVEGP